MRIRFAYTALQVRNLDESERFYREVLGMSMVLRKPVEETDGEMCVLRSGRNTLELNWYRSAVVRRGSTLDHLAFEVETLPGFRRLAKELQSKGIRIHEYLETRSWERFFVEDPDGNWVEVYARKK